MFDAPLAVPVVGVPVVAVPVVGVVGAEREPELPAMSCPLLLGVP